MSTKRYRTLRVWHNTLLMVWAAPFVVLPGVIAGAYGGHFELLQFLAGLAVVGLVVANVRDRRRKCHYSLDDERLILERNGKERSIDLGAISDASLIDRAAGREYLREWSSGRDRERKLDPAAIEEYAKYCTVDIGITSLTLGLGRSMIDRLPNAKTDLVLIRLGDGSALLLSPVHSQDLVERISRKKMQR